MDTDLRSANAPARLARESVLTKAPFAGIRSVGLAQECQNGSLEMPMAARNRLLRDHHLTED